VVDSLLANGHTADFLAADVGVEAQVSAAVAVIAESRADVERAKGMLMLIYGMDDSAAFEVLKWRSQWCAVYISIAHPPQYGREYVELRGCLDAVRDDLNSLGRADMPCQ